MLINCSVAILGHPSGWVRPRVNGRSQAAKWLDTVEAVHGAALAGPRSTWPRSDVSCDGVTATCSFIPSDHRRPMPALTLLVNPEMITGTPGGSAGTQGDVCILGDLVQEFSAYPSGDSGTDAASRTPTLIEKLPWLKSILSCWADINLVVSPNPDHRVAAVAT